MHQETFFFPKHNDDSVGKKKPFAWQLADRQKFLGTVSWRYRQWQGSFYQRYYESEGAFQRDSLREYAERLPFVCVEDSQFRWPTLANLHQWNNSTPARFGFAFQVPKHLSALGEDGLWLFHSEDLNRGSEKIKEVLGEKLRFVVVSIPGQWGVDQWPKVVAAAESLSSSIHWVFDFASVAGAPGATGAAAAAAVPAPAQEQAYASASGDSTRALGEIPRELEKALPAHVSVLQKDAGEENISNLPKKLRVWKMGEEAACALKSKHLDSGKTSTDALVKEFSQKLLQSPAPGYILVTNKFAGLAPKTIQQILTTLG